MDAKAMERAGAQTGVPAFSACFVSVRDPSDKEVLYGANRTHRSAGVGGPDPAGARGFFNGARRQWDRRGDPAFPDEPRAGGRHPYQPHYHTHLRHRRGGRVPGHPGAPRPGDSVYRRRVAVSHALPEERRAGHRSPGPSHLDGGRTDLLCRPPPLPAIPNLEPLLFSRVVAPLVPVEVPPVFHPPRVLPYVPVLQPIRQAHGLWLWLWLRRRGRIFLVRWVRL